MISGTGMSTNTPSPDGLARGDGHPSTGAITAGHTIMFWVLIGLAILAFTPCVLVPIYLEKEQVREHERILAAVVAEYERTVERTRDRRDALMADPLVNERMIRRELNLRPQGEQIVRWSPEELAALPLKVPDLSEPGAAGAGLSEPPEPGWLVSLRRWLPAWPWRQLFAESPNRTLLMLMSGGLVVAAFVLYTPRPARPA